ncbi:MAG: hypothetical protein COV76_00550 [Candidatus Omnitrophica bacterium CG11_big_fil_rev_8_21_14_0_20_64_10]|nr:MAG: hypothetical protein COV76_00550 [Candidatus Omnitrophica bacterium CG11_big_fil_rev_8_21_14_0_20_64_10]
MRLVEEKEAAGSIKKIFEEVKRTLQLPFVPKIFRALAAAPDRLEAVWGELREQVGSGHLDLRSKGVAAFAVSEAMESAYFSPIYASALKRLGVRDEELEEIRRLAALLKQLNRTAADWKLEPEL